MSRLWLVLTIALASPSALAGDFVPRQPKPAPAPVASTTPRRAKPVRKATRPAPKPKKKPRSHETWKRPMP